MKTIKVSLKIFPKNYIFYNEKSTAQSKSKKKGEKHRLNVNICE